MTASKISEIVSSLLDGVHGISKSETIIGAAQQAGEAVVIPVHRLKIAFGVGSATAGAHGSRVGGDSGAHGAGGAVELDPVAAIAIGKDGHAQLLTVDADSSGTWSQLLQEVPDIVTKIAHSLGDRVTFELQNRGLKGKAAEAHGAATPEALPAASNTDAKR